jgi:hypothetical protein
VTYGNQKFWEIAGIKGAYTSMGEKLPLSVHPEDREIIVQNLQQALEKIENFIFEVRWGQSESYRWAMGELVPEVIDDEVLLLGMA